MWNRSRCLNAAKTTLTRLATLLLLSFERMRAELGFMYELCQVVASNSELQPILDDHETLAKLPEGRREIILARF